MIPEDHPFYDYLDEALSLRLDLMSSRLPPSAEANKAPLMPIEFQDRHLAASLQLRRVQIVPELPQMLADFGETELDKYFSVSRDDLDPGGSFSAFVSTRLKALSRNDSPGKVYEKNFSSLLSFPSQLYICPNEDFWIPFAFRADPWYSLSTFITVGLLFVPNSWLDGTETRLTPSMADDMRELNEYGRLLGIWHFYPFNAHGERLVESMRGEDNFKWDIPSTTKPSSPDMPIGSVPPDGQTPLLDALLACQKRVPTRREGRRKKPVSSNTDVDAIVKAASTRRTADPSKPYRTDFKHYLQRAWSQAVVNDATFIVLSCGRYERIGVRHRHSQTLFLSDLIDPTSQHGLAYGGIQIGLFISIIHDALSRQSLRRKAVVMPAIPPVSPESGARAKRKSPSATSTGALKRSKANHEADATAFSDELDNKPVQDRVMASLSSLDMALISLRHGVYCSSNPSTFLRVGSLCPESVDKDDVPIPHVKKHYTRESYFLLDLLEQIGEGSTGIAYRARATTWTKDTGQISAVVVVKLVCLTVERIPGGDTKFLARERQRHEFRIYQHLSKANGGKGALSVYGLFEDPETGTLALVMEDGGISLTSREEKMTGSRRRITTVSDRERESALEALKAIHSCTVRHCDLRADNVVVNEKGDVHIIDFDLAQIGSSIPAREREYLCLKHILDGHGDTADFYSF